MNNSTGKWLVRAGSLILLVGFFLPSMAVSCSALGALGAKQTFSLYDLATNQFLKESLLYLVLLGGLAAIAFSFIPPKTQQQRMIFLIGQLVSAGLGALSLFFSVLTLYGQFNGASGESLMSLDYSLEFGFFFLLLGYILSGVGIVLQFFEGKKTSPSLSPSYQPSFQPPYPPPYQEAREVPPPAPYYQPMPGMGAGPQASGARLEVRGGGLPSSMFQLKDNLYIGRSSECQLQLPGSQVSRLHARVRFGNGAWFIQDQESSTGTFVNGKRVQAIKLNPGDQIRIGETILVFRA
jgi:hypothetical protein